MLDSVLTKRHKLDRWFMSQKIVTIPAAPFQGTRLRPIVACQQCEAVAMEREMQMATRDTRAWYAKNEDMRNMSVSHR